MTRRTLALLVSAAAVAVTVAAPAHADEPQSLCVGFKNNQWYCLSDEDGFVELPPIGTIRVTDLLPNS